MKVTLTGQLNMVSAKSIPKIACPPLRAVEIDLRCSLVLFGSYPSLTAVVVESERACSSRHCSILLSTAR